MTNEPPERISLVFKKLRVARRVDAKRNSHVYQTCSDHVIEGSPQDSVSVVAADAANRIAVR